jgi:hypothetical protein
MQIIAILLISLSLVACKYDTAKLDERIAFWKNALASDLPVGTNADEIKKWGATHGVKFDDLKVQHWLYANVESVPETGIPFPCSAWNIIIKITVDTTNRSVQNNVSTVGSCI